MKVLEGIGAWLATNGEAIYATVKAEELTSSDSPWIRWTAKLNKRYAIIDAIGEVKFAAPASIDEGSAHVLGGRTILVTRSGSDIAMTIDSPAVEGPTVIAFNKK